MKVTKDWLTLGENWPVWIWTCRFKLMVWESEGKHLGPGESGVGETFGDKDFDDISIDITMCWGREFWKNVSVYLAASNRYTANTYYLHLDLFLLKHVRSYSVDLEGFLDVRHSLGLTFLLGDKVAQLRISCSSGTTSQEKRDGQEKVLFSLGLSPIGRKMFPWAPERSSLYHGSEVAHLLTPAPLTVRWEEFSMTGLNSLFC